MRQIPISIIVLAGIGIFFCLGLGDFPLLVPDEPRYAETAREMIERCNWIVPYCNYEPRFHKPILFYWMEIISFKVFGLNEFAARFPSCLAGVCMSWLAYLMTKRLGFGIIASLISCTSLGIFVLGKLAITDMVLCFWISASLCFFYLGYSKQLKHRSQLAFTENLGSRWFVSSWICIGLGFLTKGPVAAFLVLGIIGSFLIIEKDLKEFLERNWRECLVGLIACLIITLPWFILVDQETNGAFTKEFFINHNLQRFTSVHTGHNGSIFYYIPMVFIGLFPWSVFLFAALKSTEFSTKNIKSNKSENAILMRFCAVWFLVIFVFYSISQTKLPTYIAPALLPAIILISSWFYNKISAPSSKRFMNRDAFLSMIALIAIITIALILGFTQSNALGKLISDEFLNLKFLFIGFILISSLLLAMTAIYTEPKLSFIFLITGLIISYLGSTWLFIDKYAQYRDAGVKAISSNLNPGDDLRAYKAHSTNIRFYAQKNIIDLTDNELIRFINEPNINGKKYLITNSKIIENKNIRKNKNLKPLNSNKKILVFEVLSPSQNMLQN